jgi:hypothetical protein
LVVLRELPTTIPVVGEMTGNVLLLGGDVGTEALTTSMATPNRLAEASVPAKLAAEDVLNVLLETALSALIRLLPVAPLVENLAVCADHVVPVAPVPRVRVGVCLQPA